MTYTYDFLNKLDEKDELKSFRSRFIIPDNIIYMNGNSLGPLTQDAKKHMVNVVTQEWGEELIKGWNTAGWYELPQRLGDKIAQLVGAKDGEVTVADSTSINLFKAVTAALKLKPMRKKIISEAGNFPTDLYILNGIKELLGDGYTVVALPRGEIVNAIDDQTAAVVLTHVHYVTGEIFPMTEFTKKIHAAGAIAVWDLSHSVGAVKTDLNGAKADFAVGCGYKHLNGGPGAPAFIYAAKRHHGHMQQPLSGWMGHNEPFKFTDDYVPADGIRHMLCGTQPVLSASALEAGVDLMLEADEKSRYLKRAKMSEIFEALVAEKCEGFDLRFVSPNNATERGAHVSYEHVSGYSIMQNLIDRGVIGDYRAPNRMRFGFSPLFMSYGDLYRAVEILREILATQSYEQEKYQNINAVT